MGFSDYKPLQLGFVGLIIHIIVLIHDSVLPLQNLGTVKALCAFPEGIVVSCEFII